jgi:hypothetical protein
MKPKAPTSWIRIGFGFFLAALVPAVVLALNTPLQSGQFTIWQFGLVPVFFVFSAVAVALIGIPLYLSLQAVRLITWWSSVIAGCFGGVLVGFVLRMPGMPMPSDFVATCPVGAASALSFWMALRLRSKE